MSGCLQRRGSSGFRASGSDQVTKNVILTDISVIGPDYVPPTPPHALSPAQPWLRQCDQQLLEHLRDAGSCPIWSLLNLVADAQSPRDRTAGRLLRLELLNRVNRLRRVGLVFLIGRNWISASKFDPAVRRPAARRRRRTVRGLRSIRAVSVRTGTEPQGAPSPTHEVHRQMFNEPSAPSSSAVETEKTVSGNEPQRISEAARQLARLPRRPKRWSGWLNDRVRTYRNMRLVLPGNRIAFVFGVLRGRVVYTREANTCAGDPDEAGRSWGVVPASKVQIVKNEHAVLLGRLKRGVRKRRSPLKAASARRNGSMPARRGQRGRPKAFMFP